MYRKLPNVNVTKYVFLFFLHLPTLITSQSWYYFESYDYYIGYNEVNSYTDAEAACLTKQATLVVVKTEAVQEFLVKKLPDGPYTFYIGLQRSSLSLNGFTWIDGTSAFYGYTKWWNGEPDDKDNCVVMKNVNRYQHGYNWFGTTCNKRAGYICQRSTANYKCGTNGQPCALPFVYEHFTYYSCDTIDNNDRLWCSFDTEYKGKWANCAPCQIFTATATTTVATSITTETTLAETTIAISTTTTSFTDSTSGSNLTKVSAGTEINVLVIDKHNNTISTSNPMSINIPSPNKRNLSSTTTIILIIIGIILLLFIIVFTAVTVHRRNRKPPSTSSNNNHERNENAYENENVYENADQTAKDVTNIIYNINSDTINLYEESENKNIKTEVVNPIYISAESPETTSEQLQQPYSVADEANIRVKHAKPDLPFSVMFKNVANGKDNTDTDYDFAS